MRKSGIRLNKDLFFINSSMFLPICRFFNINHFTRNRKLPLNHLILSIINRKGLTLSMEIRRFFRLLKPNNKDSISKAGYLKQRLKLNPAAFVALNDYHIKNFYEDEIDLIKFKNHFVFAVDGSTINLPNTQENADEYGFQTNQNNAKQVQSSISCLYDVFNKMILDCVIDHYKHSERAQAEVHIDKISYFIKAQPYIIVLDRGYPSSFFFIDRLEKNQHFVVRLSSHVFIREQKSMNTSDEDIEIVFSPERINPYRNTPLAEKLRKKGSVRLRFVKILLPGNTTEFLATDLPREEFSEQDISELYRLRWGIETAYDIMKNKFMLENFTGKKPVIIEQDILSTVYLYNLTQDMLRDAEMEQENKNAKKSYKHKMVINVNTAIGIIKEDLIRMALEKNAKKRGEIFEEIIQAIASNIVPIRENRQYERKKKYPVLKHPITKKRSY